MRAVRYGIQVDDDYTWLEQEGNERVLRWLRDQDAFARALLDQSVERGSLQSEMLGLLGSDPTTKELVFKGRRTFFLRRDAGREVDALYMTELGADGNGTRVNSKQASLLVAPDTTGPSSEGAASIDYYQVSPSGKLVAVGISRGGRENATVRILDVDKRRWLEDEIPDVMLGNLSWLNEENFVYWRPNKVESGQDAARYEDTETFLHRIGQPVGEDRAIFGRRSSGLAIRPVSFPFVYLTPASPDLAWGSAGAGPTESDIFVSRRKELTTGSQQWRHVINRDARVGAFVARGSTIYLLVYADAPRGRIMALDVNRHGDKPRVLVPESDRVLQNVFLAKDGLYIQYLDAGILRAVYYSLNEGTIKEVPLPEGVSVSEIATDEREAGALLLTTSWTRSSQVIRYDPVTGTIQDTGLVEPSSLAEAGIEVKRVEVDAGDASIPMTVIHRPGLRLDGRNPTKIIAYGFYGYTYLPRYLRQERAWLRRGGIIAFAHVRGGGARGEAWHRAAVGANKIVAVRDFIRCAEYLIENGYTAPTHLIASGASTGGVLVGAAIVRRPELFRAAVLNVPVMSILRYLERDPVGPALDFEFGSLDKENDYRALLSLDAYHSIRRDQSYPPVLLMAGMNDPRVPIWQPAKFAAKLQATKGGRALLRIDFDAGHGSQTTAQKVRLLADEDAFCWSVLSESRTRGGPGG